MVASRLAFVSALLSSVLASTAYSQQATTEQVIPTPLPEQCPGGQSGTAQGMFNMGGMDTSKMDDAHKAFMTGMMRMQPAMMQGIQAEDPDVAFACGMIAHHQGAIDMAEVELKYGDNREIKKRAQEIIDAQKHEVEDFKRWLQANAK